MLKHQLKKRHGNPNNSDFAKKEADTTDEFQTRSERVYNSVHPSVNSSRQSFPYQPKTIIDDRLHQLIHKYEIQKDLGNRLCSLEHYELIILCDDSGSMETTVDNTARTRWDELRDFVKIILEIGTIFDTTGVDIYFLNRQPILNVKNAEKVQEVFSTSPYGFTPLVSVLRYIFQLPSTRSDSDKKSLVFVATDGAPTDNEGNTNVDELEYLMNEERRVETTYVVFLICTDDSVCVDYLNDWDIRMVNVDVTDDFKTERDKVRRCKGVNYPFSKGDYIVKALIGAIDPEMDSINESITNF